MISSVTDTLVSLSQNPVVKYSLVLFLGWKIRQIYVSNFKSNQIGRSKIDLVNNLIAHQIVAKSAIAFLDEEQKESLQELVEDQLEENFIDDIGFDIN